MHSTISPDALSGSCRPTHSHYLTAGGVRVQRSVLPVTHGDSIAQLRARLDTERGVLLSSSFEYPGRYNRWDVGFVNPPVVLTARERELEIEALNPRGRILLPELERALRHEPAIAGRSATAERLLLRIHPPHKDVPEELRSRQLSVFSLIRALLAHFHSEADEHLGLYGAFAYDLAFQFEAVKNHQQRDPKTRDLVLYLPDELLVADHHVGLTRLIRYEFVCRRPEQADDEMPMETTGGYRRTGTVQPFELAQGAQPFCDHAPGEYADIVRRAREYFRRGDLFEVVPGQVFHEPCQDSPAHIFARLQQRNPAPYGTLMNLGEKEYLLAASPEMYVRVQQQRVETCPISGTIARGEDAIADARQIRELLNSEKDEAELSMCTDVDRNDKSRVCVPGSVRVIGRRQVELYSRLIHTVDHVEGELAPGYDALDAFLTHAWAVTVTGAPKQSAIQFIEDHEKSPRLWYGGAVGYIGFNGNLNTGLTLRAARIKDGMAQVRVGATLLMDSDPEAEEAETRLKASALLAAIRAEPLPARHDSAGSRAIPGAQALRVLMVDHRDSFVHNLGSYFREHGVQLQTLRAEAARARLAQEHFDLVILSPGPGRPQDFALSSTLALCQAKHIPVFGVCLGLQGLVEFCGGELDLLETPMHGKPSLIDHEGGVLFQGLPQTLTVGRYHSLHATVLPPCLRVTARTRDGTVMAVEHRELPMLAVQFHPESILSLEQQAGQRLIANVVQYALQHARHPTQEHVYDVCHYARG
ncbi:MAG: anthranilate synthase component I [Gammaproteobacteria bacterium]